MLRSLLDAFWKEDVLPRNTTWSNMPPGPGEAIKYPENRHLIFPIPFALLFIILRYVLDRYVYAPFGRYLGIKDSKPKRPAPNPKLEAAYQASPHTKQLCALAKQMDMSEREVERWWRLRRCQDRPSTLVKFCEDAYKFTYYLCNFTFAIIMLWDKKWLWDIDHCFIGYPHHGLTNDVWWYYMISSAFFWSLTLSQFWDVRRKDFWQMFVHHIVTIALLSFSWINNMHRIGTLVLSLHDSANIFVEALKSAKYAGYQRTCDTLFFCFVVVWIVTRVGIFPFYLIWSVTFRGPIVMGTLFPAYYFCTALLYLLQVLHIIWTWIILQLAYNTIKAGKMERDIRSSSSEHSDSSNHCNNNIPTIANNKKCK